MKDLYPLIKLQKMKVDEQRLLLAKLQEQLDAIEKELESLKIEQALQAAQVKQNPAMALTYGDYIKSSLEHEKMLERRKRTAIQALDLARTALSELFEEQKRYEIAQQQREEEEAREEAARETKTLDEVGSVSFTRKKK